MAVTRAKELPARIGFTLFIACASSCFTPGLVPLIWLAAILAVQGLDHWIAAPLRRHPEVEPSRRRKVAYFLVLTLISTVYSSIAAFVWFEAGLPGKLFAFLLPAGSLMNLAMQMERAPRSLLPVAAPHGLYLIGLPLTSGLLSPDANMFEMAFVSLGALVFLCHVAMAVRRIQRSAHAQHDARDEAEQALRAAERANAAKSDFLATISHEIRTPMNAVVAAAGLLQRTPLNTAQREHVEMLTHSAELLTGLLKDVLDLSKIESGKLVMERADFDLIDKLNNGVQLWRARAEEKGLTLSFDPRGLPERIVTDPLRLQQILFNLLSNAVKFTDAGAIALRGGRIASPVGERLWIEVEDSGCGMDAEAARRVFEPFEQATAGTTRQYGGTGLGLSISRRLAQLLGGDISVASAPGRGSVFRLEVPLVETIEPQAPAAVLDDDEWVNAAGARIEVLLAEDHVVNQKIVRLILEPLGVVVTVAENGLQAVDLAAQRPFDVILMDMQMPVMDGIEAAMRIRRHPGPNATTPILALTANVMDEHRARWSPVQVAAFLTKPIDIRALVSAVRDAAAKQPAAEREAAFGT